MELFYGIYGIRITSKMYNLRDVLSNRKHKRNRDQDLK